MPWKPTPAIDVVVNNLVDVSNVIHNRMGLRAHEERRVNEAFTLLAASEAPTQKNVKMYLEFLQRVKTTISIDFVVLIAVGLGRAAVNGMKDRLRVDLPAAIKPREKEFTLDVVKKIVAKYTAKYSVSSPLDHEAVPPNIIPLPTHATPRDVGLTVQGQSAFTGDAYELDLEDVKDIASSGQIVGQVYLIDTYTESSHSFALVPLSSNLANHFAMLRRKVQDVSINPGE